MTHSEFAKKAKPERPCTAHDMTFGGKCLNCGYDPEKKESTLSIRESLKKIKLVREK